MLFQPPPGPSPVKLEIHKRPWKLSLLWGVQTLRPTGYLEKGSPLVVFPGASADTILFREIMTLFFKLWKELYETVRKK